MISVTRGRPRSEGELHCDRCSRSTAKIRVTWPDGAICGICFTKALRTWGTCPTCGTTRLLPGRSASGNAICRDCAGITTEMTCEDCGEETERFRAGRCIRCVLLTDLEILLQPDSPPDLRLKRLTHLLTLTDRPESIYTWMRKTKTKNLLAQIGTREIELSHEAFDSIPESRAVEHLREMLVHHYILPHRDRQLAKFERWLETRLGELSETPHIQSPVEAFARWHHLKRLRNLANHGPLKNTSVNSAKQEITAAGNFLAWLEAEHGITSLQVRQAHLDEYLSAGTSTRSRVRTFIVWLTRKKDVANIEVPHRYSSAKPMMTQGQRLDLIGRCLSADSGPLAVRVAALLLLLYAQPIGKIAALRCEDLEPLPDGLHLRLGNLPALVPSQFASVLWQHLNARQNQQTGNSGSAWLFPGTLPGQHLHPDVLMVQLRNLGVDIRGARNSALRSLVEELPPTLIANALGYSYGAVHRHAEDAGAPFAGYAGQPREPRRR